jgi:hypothetical protein
LPGPIDQSAEPVQVDLLAVNLQQVPTGPMDQPSRPIEAGGLLQRAPNPGDVRA